MASENYDIMSPDLIVKTLEANTYKSTAYAVAEIVDNSIQAGETISGKDKKFKVNVEVLCIDKKNIESNRNQISEIAVFDNACGMDKTTLRKALMFGNGTRLNPDQHTGMGRYGIGLPNSSLSQCDRVDVYSWQNGVCYHAFLDKMQIATNKQRHVPEPKKIEIPKKWKNLVNSKIEKHGTIVVWSELSRVTWKTSKSFLDNSEFLIGRIYRHFIYKNKATIRLVAFVENSDGEIEATDFDKFVRPNDPLFLMKNTIAEDCYKDEPVYEQYGEDQIINHKYRGVNHKVRLVFSLIKGSARKAVQGNSVFGKLAAKNLGVSIVRADRELQIDNSFDSLSDPRDRYWGVEVNIEPKSDEIFGVTSSKQSANNFSNITKEEGAERAGMTGSEYQEFLEDTDDPKLLIYKVAEAIRSQIKTMRNQIKLQNKKKDNSVGPSSAEEVATAVTNLNPEPTSRSDRQEKLPLGQRHEALIDYLEGGGVDHLEAENIAKAYLDKSKYLFRYAKAGSAYLFDVTSEAGLMVITINVNHAAYDAVFSNLDDESSPSSVGLKLLLCAWARVEDSAGNYEIYDDIRLKWGQIAREFIKESEQA